jgi:hypothetical protein
VKRGQVWAGSPAKLLRVMTPEEGAFVAGSASNYAALATEHAIEAGKVGGGGGEQEGAGRPGRGGGWLTPAVLDVLGQQLLGVGTRCMVVVGMQGVSICVGCTLFWAGVTA